MHPHTSLYPWFGIASHHSSEKLDLLLVVDQVVSNPQIVEGLRKLVDSLSSGILNVDFYSPFVDLLCLWVNAFKIL